MIVATAMAATWFGREQLKLVVEARRDALVEQKLNLKIQQGLQLMEIDKQYEGTLLDSRRAFALLRQSLLGQLTATDPALRRAELAKLMSDHLTGLRLKSSTASTGDERKNAARDYFELMQLPNYIETIGVLVAEELVDSAAVLRLYDGMVVTAIGNLRPHISTRRDRDENPSYLLFAERLYERSLTHLSQPI